MITSSSRSWPPTASTPDTPWMACSRLRISKYATSYSSFSVMVSENTLNRHVGTDAVGSKGMTIGGRVPGGR